MLIQDGLSSAHISKRISAKFRVECSRNAVIGKAHRLQLRTRSPIVKAQEIRSPKRLPPVPRLVVDNTIPEPKPMGDVDHGCRFMHGEPRKRNFCGADNVVGTSWCSFHAFSVWTAPTPKQIEARNRLRAMPVRVRHEQG